MINEIKYSFKEEHVKHRIGDMVILSDYLGKTYVPYIIPSLKNKVLKQTLGETYTYIQKGVEYQINSLGYRGAEFEKNVDLLALGCSNTFGQGIPQECSWPYLINSNKIKTINSLAASGDSAQGQVIKFFEYVKKFGNPKNLFAVMPVYRFEFPLDQGYWEISDPEKSYTLVQDGKARVVISHELNKNFEKYAAAPYDPNVLFTKNMARYYTHTFLNILETYCKNNNINFKYTIYEWDYRHQTEDPQESIKNLMLNYSDSYFDYDYPMPSLLISKEEEDFNCHSDLKNKYFYRAIDYDPGKRSGHMGFHEQIHIAETLRSMVV